MHVAVVGGGIGGLSLALQLERAGIRCRVYEGVAEYTPLGVGIIRVHRSMSPLWGDDWVAPIRTPLLDRR
jgi:2-polyprenyl-6-methoxyphenol hydroxylase-like FAD-dependent oxidoreductase